MMIAKVKKAIQKYAMIKKKDRIVVAVSGGPDSMALLRILDIISDEYELTLCAAHLNHGMRAEVADQEENFVRNYCRNMGIDFESKKIHVAILKRGSGKSIEEIARDERYRFLMKIARKYGAQKIALGHHLQDQAETVIMNFLRGSGAEGLKGMLPVRDSIFIRPLLGITKEEILDFLEDRRLTYRVDASNENPVYLRNRIRHGLIPFLKEQFNPKLEETLGAMAEIMGLENDYMEMVTGHILADWGVALSDEEIRIKRDDLLGLHRAIQTRIIRTMLKKFSPFGKGIGYIHIQAAVNLAGSHKPGGQIKLPFGIHIRREYDWLCFGRQAKEDISERGFCYTVSVPDKVHIQELNKIMTFELVQHPGRVISGALNTAYLDYDEMIPPLTVRTTKPGDVINPLGMAGTKKVKSYFIDEKIPLIKRKKIPLLVDGESVVWIAGMRLSERVKITDKSRKILKVEIV